MIAVGVGGPITGRGADLAIIEDPVKNWEDAMSQKKRQTAIDWYQSTLHTRVEPNGAIICLQTRWHQRDLMGWVLSEENEARGEWTQINLPATAETNDAMGRSIGAALCPERFNEEALAKIKKAVGSRVWASLYQQRPSAEEGNIVKREHLRYYAVRPEQCDEFIQSWDMSFTGKEDSDFVVGTCWARRGPIKFLIDRVRGQWGMNDTLKQVREFSIKHPYATLKLIENKANGPAIEDMLNKELSGILLWEPRGDKVSRLHACAPQFEAGNIMLPDPRLNPWVNEYVDELVSFPTASYDDQVDSTTMALIRLEESFSSGVGTINVIK
jgi:predicted phage terminase large subunit-like protein